MQHTASVPTPPSAGRAGCRAPSPPKNHAAGPAAARRPDAGPGPGADPAALASPGQPSTPAPLALGLGAGACGQAADGAGAGLRARAPTRSVAPAPAAMKPSLKGAPAAPGAAPASSAGAGAPNPSPSPAHHAPRSRHASRSASATVGQRHGAERRPWMCRAAPPLSQSRPEVEPRRQHPAAAPRCAERTGEGRRRGCGRWAGRGGPGRLEARQALVRLVRKGRLRVRPCVGCRVLKPFLVHHPRAKQHRDAATLRAGQLSHGEARTWRARSAIGSWTGGVTGASLMAASSPNTPESKASSPVPSDGWPARGSSTPLPEYF